MKVNCFFYLAIMLHRGSALPLDDTIVDLSAADFTNEDFAQYYDVCFAQGLTQTSFTHR
jgi:hypothetical protein